jgi:hypothetical protein
MEAIARERFEGLAGAITTEVRTIVQEGDSTEEVVDAFMGTPPMVAAREAMPPEAFERYGRDVTALVGELSEHSEGKIRMESEYLLTVARKPG